MTDGFADHWTTNKYRDSREDVASQLHGLKFRGHRCTLFYDCIEPSDDVLSADTSQLWTGLYVVVDDSGDAFNESADFGPKTYVTDDFSYGDIPIVAQSPKSNVLLHDSKSLVEQRNRLDEGLHTKCSIHCLNVDITLSEIQPCKKCETSEMEKQGCTLSLDSHKEHQRHKHIDSTCSELCSDHCLNKKLTAERTLRSSFSETNVVTKRYVWNESSSTSCARLWCNSVPENEVIKHSENAHDLQCEYDKTSLHLTTKANYLIGCQENNQMSRELILNDSNINKEISTLIGNLNRELQVRSSNVHRSELDGRLHLENPISLTNDTGLNWNSNADEHLRHERDDEYLKSRLTDPMLTSKLQKIREDREGLMFVVNLLLTWNIIQLLVLFATLFYACICICSFRKGIGCGELCLLKPKQQPKSAKKRWWST
ncbi:hypothetical protein Bpfe_022828 [Biomphalaria pfeifferi]|uniref:Uncharacterized protein n=1 Tax=Biomphalaria pfeifferi TaxID=112525 RepID=A0AAD8B4B4_BIOPF|nr:hypothetical protein Bpfe_022828 [Biomphalaria pfeifferi]